MLHELLDPVSLIKFAGLVGVVLIVFAESGLFFGFFFPGDSLLFTAGFLISQNVLSFPGVPAGWGTAALFFVLVFVAAVVGDNVGYMFGKKVGVRIFIKEDSLFFNKKYPVEAQKFYDRYGTKTIVLARFVPVVRTFAPIVAGVGRMNYRVFLRNNLLGGALWTILLAGGGYALGNTIPQASRYIGYIIAAIIVVSVVPPVLHFLKERRAKKNL